MTVADLIAKWFESRKQDKLSVFQVYIEKADALHATIRYNHTRLLSTDTGSHYPEWLFYEIMDITEFEVIYQDINRVKRSINVHEPDFFEKLDKEIKNQIERIERNTTTARLVQSVAFGFNKVDPNSASAYESS